MSDKEEFLELCAGIERDGIKDLMEWLEGTDFYEAPASTRYHLSCPGGLLHHSLNVYHEAKKLLGTFPEIQVSEDTVRITALFHDLCKVNFYGTEKRNVKTEFGRWETRDVYTVCEKVPYGAHGAKSLSIVQNFVKLSAEECVAILQHMGTFQGEAKDVGSAFSAFPYAWLLSVADQAATYIDENEKG